MIFRHGSVNINFQNRDDIYCIIVYFVFALGGNFLTLTVLCGFVVVDLLFNVPPLFLGVLCWSLLGMPYFTSILVFQSFLRGRMGWLPCF